MQTGVSWPCLAHGGTTEDIALCFDAARRWRLLIVPALLDEATRMRRFTVEVMRRLDGAGIDCFLPDLPGCHESLAPLAEQTPGTWQQAMAQAADHFGATHVLAIRGGALVAPPGLPGWRYAAVAGATLMRQLLRARILAAHEAGRVETQETLLKLDQTTGLELAGMRLRAGFMAELMALAPAPGTLRDIPQAMLLPHAPAGLWLRTEPGEDAAQADALAAIITAGPWP